MFRRGGGELAKSLGDFQHRRDPAGIVIGAVVNLPDLAEACLRLPRPMWS